MKVFSNLSNLNNDKNYNYYKDNISRGPGEYHLTNLNQDSNIKDSHNLSLSHHGFQVKDGVGAIGKNIDNDSLLRINSKLDNNCLENKNYDGIFNDVYLYRQKPHPISLENNLRPVIQYPSGKLDRNIEETKDLSVPYDYRIKPLPINNENNLRPKLQTNNNKSNVNYNPDTCSVFHPLVESVESKLNTKHIIPETVCHDWKRAGITTRELLKDPVFLQKMGYKYNGKYWYR